jgi:plasmid stability protein
MQQVQVQAAAHGLDCEALIRQWLEERLQQEDSTANTSAS